MNKQIIGGSLLAIAVAFSTGANSLSANTNNQTNFDSGLPLPLAYFQVNAGQHPLDLMSEKDELNSDTAEPHRSQNYFYQHGQKPISVYRNRAQQKTSETNQSHKTTI